MSEPFGRNSGRHIRIGYFAEMARTENGSSGNYGAFSGPRAYRKIATCDDKRGILRVDPFMQKISARTDESMASAFRSAPAIVRSGFFMVPAARSLPDGETWIGDTCSGVARTVSEKSAAVSDRMVRIG